MMMKSISFLLLLVMIFFTACKNEPEETEEPSIFAACCEIDPATIELGEGRVYVPNIFTPDDNGINDFFFPLGNSEIEKYETFTIRRPSGELIYEVTNLPAEVAFSFSWTGKPDQEVLYLDDEPFEVIAGNGAVLRGVFDYMLSIRNKAGDSINIEGRICSFPCGPNDPMESELTNVLNCLFPANYDGSGGFDPDLSNFESWDCIF